MIRTTGPKASRLDDPLGRVLGDKADRSLAQVRGCAITAIGQRLRDVLAGRVLGRQDMLRQRTKVSGTVAQGSKALRHLAGLLLLAAVGCDTQSFRVGQRANIQFGTVRQVEEVRLQSDAAAGALIGGTIGLIASGGSRTAPRNAILGAAVGAGATAVAQGNRTGIAYTVAMLDGSTVRIISDQSEIRVGDCVAIERVGETNNIRREPSAYCARDNQQAVATVRNETEAAAARCEAAKEELVRASTAEAVDTAGRKVNLLCN